MTQKPEPKPRSTALLRQRHDGKSMLFHCIDDYFGECHGQRRRDLGQPFGASLAGGGLAFLLEGTQVAACMQVAAGCVISGTRDLYVLSHIDCGAYKYFAGVDWSQHSQEAQVGTLWRDLHLAEAVIRDYLSSFNNPLDSDWSVPDLKIHLDVVDLQERSVPEPNDLADALPPSYYRGIRLPKTI